MGREGRTKSGPPVLSDSMFTDLPASRSSGSRGVVARRIRTILLLIAAFVVTLGAHHRLPDTVRSQIGGDYVPRPEFAKAMSLGFDALLADYYWVQAVLLSGGSLDPQSESIHLGRLVDVVTTLDPWVDHPYRFAAVWLTDSDDEVRHANRLLRRSFAYHPEDWRNRFYLGFNLFYYLDDKPAAAAVLEEASSLPGAPHYLPRLAARLRSQSGDLAAAGLFLEELVQTSEDSAARAGYQAALDEVRVEWRARSLDRARESYKARYGKDIEFVEQLVTGPHPILPWLPSPEPSPQAAPLGQASQWTLSGRGGAIVSSYYGRRYEVHRAEGGQKFDR